MKIYSTDNDNGSRLFSNRRGQHHQRGFTMVEVLVVMAISVILLGLIFGPILSSFNFVARGEQTAAAQEAARRAIQQVSREVKDAVQVAVAPGDLLKFPQTTNLTLQTRGVVAPGYINCYDEKGQPHQLAGALLDFLPADDTLGLHPAAGGSSALANPLIPQVTSDDHTHEGQKGGSAPAQGRHNVIIRYFVGLKDPGYPHARSSDKYSRRLSDPIWANFHVQQDVLSAADVDNVYVLYRIEFDTDDPAFGNWRTNTPPYEINPDFFYDNRVASNGEPYWANWRRNAVALSDTRDIDLVRFIRDPNTGAVTQAQSTVTFTPTVIQNDAATAAGGQEGSPLSYVASHGNWTGVQNNGSLTATGFNPPAIGFYPHIMVYEPTTDRNGSTNLKTVYDNWQTHANDPSYPDNSRVLTWDSKTGTVRFNAGHFEGGLTQDIQINYQRKPTDNGYDFDLIQMAVAANKLKVPDPLKPYIKIVPGSEVISLTYYTNTVDANGNPTAATAQRTDLFRRNTGNRMMEAPRPEWWDASQPYPDNMFLPEPGTYTFDPETGHILIGFPWPGPNNVQRPQPIPIKTANNQPSGPVLNVHFTYQTNTPNDVVRVDYATRGLLTASVGIRMFDPSTSRPIIAQLNNRIALRNVGR